MRKIMMTLAAASALAIGAPAAAQWGSTAFDSRINQLQANLQSGVRSGRITRNEAVQLRERLRALSTLERRFSRDGLSRREREVLQQRVQTLRQQIRMAAQNGNTRPRYDRDDDRRYGGRACPPGLERKENGCMPPGQVGRRDRDRDRDRRRDRDD